MLESVLFVVLAVRGRSVRSIIPKVITLVYFIFSKSCHLLCFLLAELTTRIAVSFEVFQRLIGIQGWLRSFQITVLVALLDHHELVF